MEKNSNEITAVPGLKGPAGEGFTNGVKKDTENFDASEFPGLLQDVEKIKGKIGLYPVMHRADIIISYCQTHTIKTEWINSNPELTRAVTDNVIPVREIESLFQLSKLNDNFKNQFENFLRLQLK